jgi:thioesterase domain-containing protein
LGQFLQFNRIDIPDQSEPLNYHQAEELIHQREAAESVLPLPPKQLMEFMVESGHANQFYRTEHVPDVFDGDMVIFSAARSSNGNGSSHLQSWRPYVAGDITTYSVDCEHHEMLTTASLGMYSDQLKLSLEA